MPRQTGQTGDFPRQFRRKRRLRRLADLGDVLCGRCRIRARQRCDPVLAQEITALAQKHRVAHGRTHLVQLRARHRQQVDMHPNEGFGDDMKAA